MSSTYFGKDFCKAKDLYPLEENKRYSKFFLADINVNI